MSFVEPAFRDEEIRQKFYQPEYDITCLSRPGNAQKIFNRDQSPTMPEILVECPFCESTVLIPQDQSSDQFVCSTCRSTFKIADAISIDPRAVTSPVAHSAPEAQVSFKPGPVKNSANSLDLPPPPLPASSPQGLANLLVDSPTATSSIRHQLQRRKKTQGLVFAGTMLGFTLLIAVFGTLIVIRLQSGPTAQPPASTPLANVSTPDPATEAASAVPEIEAAASHSPDTLVAEEPVVPPPPPKFIFLSKKQAMDVWKTTRPHLLSLEIEGPLGKQFATGTLCDSRGWVLTSYQAIKDAWQIEAIAAVDSLAESTGNPPLRDLVRGIVATDPEHDLALLSVNRRFVVSFASLNLGTDNKIVQGEYLLACAPPSRANYHGIAEVKIESRGLASELGPDARSKTKALSLDSPTTLWLTISGGTGIYPGAPILSSDGTVKALVSFTKQELAYALPVDRVQDLIRRGTDNLQPLQTPTVRLSSGEPVVLATDHQARQIVAELNETAVTCEAFGWLPSDVPQYQSLQEFSQKFSVGLKYVREQAGLIRPSAEQRAARETVQKVLDQWNDLLAIQVADTIANDRTRIDQINLLAMESLKLGDNNPVPFLGSLHVGGLETPQLILKFEESETFVNVPFDSEGPVMRPGTHWLFFVQTPPRAEQRLYRLPTGGDVKTNTASFQFAIGPLENF